MCFFGTEQLQDWAGQKLLSIDWSSGLAKPRLERKLSHGLNEENRGFFPHFYGCLGFFTLVLGMEPKTLGLMGKGSTTERHLPPFGGEVG